MTKVVNLGEKRKGKIVTLPEQPIPAKTGLPKEIQPGTRSVTIHMGMLISPATPLSVRYRNNKSEFVADMQLLARIYKKD